MTTNTTWFHCYRITPIHKIPQENLMDLSIFKPLKYPKGYNGLIYMSMNDFSVLPGKIIILSLSQFRLEFMLFFILLLKDPSSVDHHIIDKSLFICFFINILVNTNIDNDTIQNIQDEYIIHGPIIRPKIRVFY